MDHLKSIWVRDTKVCANEVSIVSELAFIGREAGIGKTRLVQEFIQRTQNQNFNEHILAWRGRASTIDRKLFFPSLFQALRSAIDGLITERREQLKRDYPYLGAFFPEFTSRISYSAAQGMGRIWLFEMLRRFVMDLIDCQTVILWIDDLPYADNDTLEWLQYFFSHNRTCKLLFIGTCRSPEPNNANPYYVTIESSWSQNQLMNRIILKPLQKLDSCKLITEFLGDKVTDERKDFVIERAGGIPLFIIEMLQMVSRHIVSLLANPHISEFLRNYVPSHVSEIISSRIASMPDLEKRGRNWQFHRCNQVIRRAVRKALLPQPNLLGSLNHNAKGRLINSVSRSDYARVTDEKQRGYFRLMNAILLCVALNEFSENILLVFYLFRHKIRLISQPLMCHRNIRYEAKFVLFHTDPEIVKWIGSRKLDI